MKISACMIAKNEEKVIARCIESYHNAVDEIIVVDTGSTDQTVPIAQKYGAKIFYFKWCDDFAAAKNYAISKAKGDWIVFLDADEYFGNDTGHNLRNFLKNLNPAFNAVGCKMVNIDKNDGKVLDVITHVRIFKNDKNIRYVNPIHEMLQHKAPGQKINAFLADAKDLVIYHTGYSSNNQHVKAQRNLDLLLRELPRAKDKPAYYQYIADCYLALGEFDKVIEYTRLFLASGAKMAAYNVRPHTNLIDAMLKLEYPVDEIMREIDMAIDKFPYHPVFHFYKGNLLYDLKHYDEAFMEHQEALKLHINYDSIEYNSLHVNLWRIYNVLGAISEHRNEYGAALDYYIESLKSDKYNAPCFDRLMILLRTQPLEDIILLLNKLYSLHDETDLDFLVSRLVNHAAPRVLAYYTSLREKKCPKQDFIVLQMLVANGYYNKAFPTLLDCYMKDGDEQLAVVAAATALLSNNKQYIDLCLRELPLGLTKIIRAYYGENVVFSYEDKALFLGLVNIFILWADDSYLERLLALSELFPLNIAAEIGDVFVKHGYYQTAAQFFQYALQKASESNQTVSPTLYFNLGYCLHRSREYRAAVQAFLAAYEAGYRENDIYEFLRWDLAKIEETGEKEKIEKILSGLS